MQITMKQLLNTVSKSLLYSLLVILLTLFSACDPVSNLIINPENKGTLNFQCGTAEIKAKVMRFYYHDVTYHLKLNSDCTVHPDSLKVQINGVSIDCTIGVYDFGLFNTYRTINSSTVLKKGDNTLMISFTTEKVGSYDAIVMKDYGYLYCGQDRINIGDLTILKE